MAWAKAQRQQHLWYLWGTAAPSMEGGGRHKLMKAQHVSGGGSRGRDSEGPLRVLWFKF